MQYTANYNLNLPEGTDIVNPLVQDNPNYTAIDGAMYANKLRVVGTATELTTGTVHAITRVDTDIPVFRFVATSDYNTGDTFTVDGVSVTARRADGAQMKNKAYVINSTVLCILDGTILNFIGVDGIVSGSNVSYDGTSSGLSATNVQDAIDETVNMINPGSVSVTADGIKTYRTLLNELASLMDGTKITTHSTMEIGSLVLHVSRYSSTPYRYGSVDTANTTSVRVFGVSLSPALSSCHYTVNTLGSSNTVDSQDSNIPTSGDKLTVHY